MHRSRLSQLAALAVVLLLLGISGQLPRLSAQERAPAEMPVAAAPRKSMLAVIRDGGPAMYPLALCSVALLVFIFERLVSLRRGRVIPRPFVMRFLEQLREGQLDREKAIKLCDANGSPVAKVFAAAAKKWGRTSVEVEQAILDAGERVNKQLRR